MEFAYLGTLQVTDGDRILPLGGPRQQIVLATLLLDANRAISLARITEAIYDEDIPSTSRAQVQIAISTLRRLFTAQGEPGLIATRPPGYALCAPAASIDYLRFDEAVRRAREARRDNRTGDAVRHYRAALGEWRGPALEGIESRLLRTVAAQLTERLVATSEDCLQLELDLGHHDEIVGELTGLVAAHPLRERLRGQLMLALYRSGRQAEALQIYRQTRETMLEELGIEPNERLRKLQRAILNGEANLDVPVTVTATPPQAQLPVAPPEPVPEPAPTATPKPAFASLSAVAVRADGALIPRMLPTDIDDFTGRTKHLDTIRQQLMIALSDQSRRAVPVIVLAGKPGIGKTSTAVHASHAIADLFPDGQLFADLHGTSSPVGPAQVLDRFLRALGVPGTPTSQGVDERAEMYRGLLAGRRVLVVLDDAGSESQILPLLPGNAGSAVLVTSRSRLAGVAGTIHLSVDVFEPHQSVDLLARIAGRDRIEAEPQAALQLTDLCGHLPLALRIAGARLSARPHWSVGQLAARLEDETQRLDELRHGAMGIRASIAYAYDSSSPGAQQLFRRLAILDSGSFSGWISAALLDLNADEAQDLLDDLADAQLIETTGDGRGIHSQYRFHDLIRVYARERLAADEPPAERGAALRRMLGALLYLSEEAYRREYGSEYGRIRSDAERWPLPDRLVRQLIDEPLVWYERERLTFIAGIRQAAEAGFVKLCWDLTMSAVTLFESRMYLDDWRQTHEVALAAAREGGDRRGTAAVLYSTGSLHLAQRRFHEARQDFERALPLFTEVGDDFGLALAIRNLAFLDRLNGDVALAAERYDTALTMFEAGGDAVSASYVLHNLAQLRLDVGDLNDAERLLDRALELSSGRSRRVQAQVLHRKGETLLRQGVPDRAADVFSQALLITQASGDRAGEAYTLHGLGMAQLAGGRVADAQETLLLAATVSAKAGERMAYANSLLGLGELALAQGGDAAVAAQHGEEALPILRTISAPVPIIRILLLLAEAYTALGDRQRASTRAAEAAALLDGLGAAVAAPERARLAALPLRAA